MKELIENFSSQIKEAIVIGENAKIDSCSKTVKNVVLCGLGGSGIGSSFVKDALVDKIEVPVIVEKGYFLPKFVNEDSLVIVSSYSGNTEEALNCLEIALSRNASICAISSNGKLEEICLEKSLNYIKIPGGNPPRACLGYSSTQLFYVLQKFGLIDDSFKSELNEAVQLLNQEKEAIKKEAKLLADKVYDKIPVLYSSDSIESLTVRWRQQINENGKQLAWHNVVPEMNHNELVGWREENQELAVIFIRNRSDYPKVSQRMDLNKTVYQTYTDSIFEVWSKGNSFIEKGMYLVSLGDWLSFYLSELRGFDVTEVKVIDALKANLK